MTELERRRMEDALGGPLPPHMPHPTSLQQVACPLLVERRCSIHADRPLIPDFHGPENNQSSDGRRGQW
jgi:hypothetical protein